VKGRGYFRRLSVREGKKEKEKARPFGKKKGQREGLNFILEHGKGEKVSIQAPPPEAVKREKSGGTRSVPYLGWEGKKRTFLRPK